MITTNEIIKYLREIKNKPYNIQIRNFYEKSKIEYPCIALHLSSINDNLVLHKETKYKDVQFTFEIYGKNMSYEHHILDAETVILTVQEWLDRALKEKYGFTCSMSSPVMPYKEDNSILRMIFQYKGRVSHDGFIYQ